MIHLANSGWGRHSCLPGTDSASTRWSRHSCLPGTDSARTVSHPRGSVLIVTIGIVIALTGLALVFTREMRVEALASGNLLSSAQADAIASGAAQYVINRLVNNQDRTTLDSEIQSEAVTLGDGKFWLLRADPENERNYAFGIVDESSKLNINTATLDMLLRLPGMTQELAASIIDWRDPDDEISEGGGAESSYYLLQPEPYYCKNAPFETLDELQLVKGATREILYGVDTNRNGVVDTSEGGGSATQLSGFNGQSQCGICKYLTVYSVSPNTTSTGQPRIFAGDNRTSTLTALAQMLSKTIPADRVASITTLLRSAPPSSNILDFYVKSKMTPPEFKAVADLLTTDRAPILMGKVNINTAPREVLRCLPGLEDGDLDMIIAKRTTGGSDLQNIAWVAELLPPAKAALVGGAITTRSYQYSADIVGLSGNRRSARRFKYVFDLRTSPPHVAYCRELTHLGWPLAADVRDSMRSGSGLPATSQKPLSLGTR